jgi:hypothetical protein
MKKIFTFEQGKKWYQGSLTVNYNLKWFLWPFILLVMLIYGIWLGIAWVLEKVWNGICWLAKHVWLLILAIVPFLKKFWNWLKSLFARKPRQHKPAAEKKNRNWNWILWLLAAILILLLLLLCIKNCGGKEQEAEPETIEYQTAWNDALYGRVFLDGLKNDATLAGYKYRDGKPAKEAEFNGDAASEAWNVMYDEWLPILQNNITVELTANQKVAAWLYALRSGKYGFAKSDFVKLVNAGDMEKAGEALMKVHKANGQVREAGEELTSYLYAIRLIWDGEISIEELKSCHCFAYKAYPVAKGYQPQELIEVIKTKNPLNAATPNELLK